MNYVVEKIKKNEPSRQQWRLKQLTGRDFAREEANFVLEKVIDHKWFMGEWLKRDVGFRVAAIDYIENFYDEGIFRKRHNTKGGFSRLLKPLNQLTSAYFTSKNKIDFRL